MTRAALPAYLLASVTGLAGMTAVLPVAGGATLPLGATDLPLAYVLPPLVGLALFQLVFGAVTGRWRGLRFWAVGLPVTAAIWGAGLVLMLGGHVTAIQALAGVSAAMMLAGLLAGGAR